MTVKEFAEYLLKNFDNNKKVVFQKYYGDPINDEFNELDNYDLSCLFNKKNNKIVIG